MMTLSASAEPHMRQPRVPADKLAEARSFTSPFPDSPETVEKGKVFYDGKGTCVNCHGQSGAGDGPVAASLNPAPQNFHQHGIWRHRTSGEILWVITFGSPGTSMIGFGGVLTDEEIWAIIQYEQSFAGEHGPGRGMGPRHGMGGTGSEALDVVPIKTPNRELSRHCCLLRQTLIPSDLECPTSLILRPEHCPKIPSNCNNR